MARPKKEENNENVTVQAGSESKTVLNNLLKTNKSDHYNFEDDVYYKVPSSSMIMNDILSGGLSPGVCRLTGTSSGGKTSSALDFLKNFLKAATESDVRKGLFFRCEGRLGPEIKSRSGVKFVDKVEDWDNGTCLVIDSNVFEFVFDTIRQLIVQNDEKVKYFFIVDSVDMMAKRADLEKGLEDAQQVAGGALITSVFLKKVSVALAKRGHIAVFISQVRETVSLNPYAKTPPKQGGASGGHALEHAPDIVLEFLPRFGDDIIREGDEKNGRPLGHYARCKVVKASNESYLREIRYPIAYGRTNGNSVWREKEILDMLQMYKLVTRAGAWYALDEKLKEEIRATGLNVEDKYQGINGLNAWLEENPAVVDFLAPKLTITS